MIYFERKENDTIGIKTNSLEIAKNLGIEKNFTDSDDDFVLYNEHIYLKSEHPEYVTTLEDLQTKQRRIAEIQAELTNLSQDFIQAELGAVFEDLDTRKEQFRTLHNELRELLGKSPREYLTNAQISDNTIEEGEQDGENNNDTR